MKAQADGNMPREADGHRNMGDAGGANRDRPRELKENNDMQLMTGARRRCNESTLQGFLAYLSLA